MRSCCKAGMGGELVELGRADRLVETCKDIAAVREALRGAEERTLAEIAVVLAEATESVVRALGVVWEGQLILSG